MKDQNEQASYSVTDKIESHVLELEGRVHLMKSSLFIKEDFLSIAEENNLFLEIEPTLKKRRYEFDHWDNVKKDYIYFF